jgi:pyridoxamine 5'-phosphate oxidase-like protein
MNVVTWASVREQRPDLAAHVQARMTGICYLATVRRDGAPRVHPVGLNFEDDRILVPMTPTSPKGRDLRRHGYFAVHCTVEDTNGGGGEVLLTGMAEEVEPTETFAARGWIAFELRVGEILSIRHASDGEIAVERWHPD